MIIEADVRILLFLGNIVEIDWSDDIQWALPILQTVQKFQIDCRQIVKRQRPRPGGRGLGFRKIE